MIEKNLLTYKYSHSKFSRYLRVTKWYDNYIMGLKSLLYTIREIRCENVLVSAIYIKTYNRVFPDQMWLYIGLKLIILSSTILNYYC